MGWKIRGESKFPHNLTICIPTLADLRSACVKLRQCMAEWTRWGRWGSDCTRSTTRYRAAECGRYLLAESADLADFSNRPQPLSTTLCAGLLSPMRLYSRISQHHYSILSQGPGPVVWLVTCLVCRCLGSLPTSRHPPGEQRTNPPSRPSALRRSASPESTVPVTVPRSVRPSRRWRSPSTPATLAPRAAR